MSKGQRGNKEAKKPKKPPAPAQPMTPGGSTPMVTAAAAPRPKK